MTLTFQPIAHSWVAQHPEPIGVVEFLGGALYGTLPHLSYLYFLRHLYEAGYTVIAVPFRFGFNHASIAQSLLAERDQIRAELNYSEEIPHFWMGHSLGCKYIALLEAYGNIFNQPSLLIAPDISDTKDALPIPALSRLFDRLHLGANPTKPETQALIQQSKLFNLTAIISFENDTIAGNARQSAAKSDVAWFIQELQHHQDSYFIHREISGGHREPIGFKWGNTVVRPDPRHGIFEPIQQRQIECLAIQCLQQLALKLAVNRHKKGAQLHPFDSMPNLMLAGQLPINDDLTTLRQPRP